jgi:hypothetical protein
MRETTPEDVKQLADTASVLMTSTLWAHPSLEPQTRKATPQKLKRLNKFHSPDASGVREHALGQKALPDATHGHQHEQADRELA